LNGTQQLLTYADDVNISEENVDTTQKNTESPLDASKVVGLEVNPEKILLVLCCQKAEQKHSKKIANRSFEDIAN
jgi:hypothetical protein